MVGPCKIHQVFADKNNIFIKFEKKKFIFESANGAFSNINIYFGGGGF